VMVNLISNAVKFCPAEAGRIEISLNPDDYELNVEIKDNGIGIAEADQHVIFDKFRQVQEPSKGRPAGSGLGLSIVYRIIRHHGGRVWVKSELGKGAAFSFALPVLPAISPSPKGESFHRN